MAPVPDPLDRENTKAKSLADWENVRAPNAGENLEHATAQPPVEDPLKARNGAYRILWKIPEILGKSYIGQS